MVRQEYLQHNIWEQAEGLLPFQSHDCRWYGKLETSIYHKTIVDMATWLVIHDNVIEMAMWLVIPNIVIDMATWFVIDMGFLRWLPD